MLSITFSSAQQLHDYIEQLKIYDLESLKTKGAFKNLRQIESKYISAQLDLITKCQVKEPDSLTDISYENNQTLKNILKGDYHLFKENANDSLAFDFYIKALNSAEEQKDTILVAESCRKIMNLLFKSRTIIEVYPIYLNIYKNYLYDDNEKANYIFHYYNHSSAISGIETIKELKDGLRIANKTNNTFLKAKYNQLIGLFYQYYKKELDSALVYQFKAKKLMESKDHQFFVNEMFGIHANIGLAYQQQNKLELADKYFIEANKVKILDYRYVEKVKIRELLSTNAYLQEDYQKAYDLLIDRNKFMDTLNEYSKAEKLNEINTKYKTEKKAKENLKLKTDIEKKDRQRRNLWIGSIAFLLIGSSLAFLIQQNTKRKQKLAEQEKELETQKLATVLKEQELTSIDAMIEGQEKERQRIANDLHDDLGGLMATVKLHFNALKDKQTPELYTKTNELIDEAYQKIRTVAHAKNSGVIAKQGLLKAINEMAEKVSASNKLAIEVIDHGLENRLENSLELTIFRIVQELITNVIKHANATEVSIHMTNHDDSLNIMVEDNGKGFNPSQVTKTNKGMGISSIDKRIEHLNGKLTIESEINNGTTIIIDIPT
ncbi:MAG: sensor histidine kinase [Psychroserpens sp.]|uniref:sensor histidine kinase n=1 Tax=Psychroserpens sp. TaxID=2020870 RepID=UPI0030034887